MRFSIKSIYGKHVQKKLFNKLFIIYTGIIILLTVIATYYVISNIKNDVLKNEVAYNEKAVESVSNHLASRIESSRRVLQQIYSNSTMFQHISYLLEHGYTDYMVYKLDLYIDSPSNSTDIMKLFSAVYSMDTDIKQIILYSKKDRCFYSITNSTFAVNSSDIVSDSVFNKPSNISNDNTNLIDAEIFYKLGIIEKKFNSYITVSSISDPVSSEYLGNVFVEYDNNGIFGAYENIANKVSGSIIVLSGNDNVIFDSSGSYYGKKYPYYSRLKKASDVVNLEQLSYINVIKDTHSGITIAGIVPKSIVDGQAIPAIEIAIVFSLLLIIIIIVITLTGIRYINKRVKMINTAMEQVQRRNLSVRIPINKVDDDLTQIAMNFNTMCDNLNQYINIAYLAEIKQKQAQLLALQNQINPHFLFNTLEAIRMRAVSEGVEDIGEMICILATLFRNCVKSEMITTVGDEIEMCLLYLKLFTMKHQNTLTFSIDISNKIMKYSMIKFSLQPIIENFIKHGLDHASSNNTITITGLFKEDIEIIIQDNGSGISPEALEKMNKDLSDNIDYPSSSIGLCNVNQRFKLIYGNQYGLNIQSRLDKGTTVIIKLPPKRKEEVKSHV